MGRNLGTSEYDMEFLWKQLVVAAAEKKYCTKYYPQ